VGIRLERNDGWPGDLVERPSGVSRNHRVSPPRATKKRLRAKKKERI